MKKAIAAITIALVPAVSSAGYIKDSSTGEVSCSNLQQITWAIYGDAEKGVSLNDEINKVVQITGEHPGEMQSIVKTVYRAYNEGYTQMQVGDQYIDACETKKSRSK